MHDENGNYDENKNLLAYTKTGRRDSNAMYGIFSDKEGKIVDKWGGYYKNGAIVNADDDSVEGPIHILRDRKINKRQDKQGNADPHGLYIRGKFVKISANDNYSLQEDKASSEYKYDIDGNIIRYDKNGKMDPNGKYDNVGIEYSEELEKPILDMLIDVTDTIISSNYFINLRFDQKYDLQTEFAYVKESKSHSNSQYLHILLKKGLDTFERDEMTENAMYLVKDIHNIILKSDLMKTIKEILHDPNVQLFILKSNIFRFGRELNIDEESSIPPFKQLLTYVDIMVNEYRQLKTVKDDAEIMFNISKVCTYIKGVQEDLYFIYSYKMRQARELLHRWLETFKDGDRNAALDALLDIQNTIERFDGFVITDKPISSTKIVDPGLYCSDCPPNDLFCNTMNRVNTITKLVCNPDAKLLKHEQTIVDNLKVIDPKQQFSIHDMYQCPVDKIDWHDRRELTKKDIRMTCKDDSIPHVETWRHAGAPLGDYIMKLYSDASKQSVMSYTSFYTYLIDIIIIPLLRTLDFFHRNNILHNNLTKNNIMVGKYDYRIRLVGYKHCILGETNEEAFKKEKEKGISILLETILEYIKLDEIKKCKICRNVIALLEKKDIRQKSYLALIQKSESRAQSRSHSSDYSRSPEKSRSSDNKGSRSVSPKSQKILSLRKSRKNGTRIRTSIELDHVDTIHTPLYSGVADDTRLGGLHAISKIPLHFIEKCYLVHLTKIDKLKGILSSHTLCNQIELLGKTPRAGWKLAANGWRRKSSWQQERVQTVGIYTMVYFKEDIEKLKELCLKLDFDKEAHIIPIIFDWSVLKDMPWHFHADADFGLFDPNVSASKYGNQLDMLYFLNNDNRLKEMGQSMLRKMDISMDHEILIYTDCIHLKDYVSPENLEFLHQMSNLV